MALRASKYRNTTSNVYRSEYQFPDLSLSTASGDGAVVAGNLWWMALSWHSNVGGSIAILAADEPGRRSAKPSLLNGHSGQINDLAWNPFHEWILASAASDGLAKVWKLPEHGLTSDTNEALVTLSGHGKRVDTLAWHPSAINILATGGSDNTIRVWDINDASAGEKLKVAHFSDNVDNLSWNFDGSLLAAVSRDKKLRVFDPRTTSISAEGDSHQAAGKPQRVTWLNQNRLFTTGFSKTRDREFMFWDSRSMAKPLKTVTLDSSPGALVPMYDSDTSLLFLAARGDATIRVMEVVEDAPYYYDLPPVFDKLPQRGVCMLPKRACHVMGAEVVKLYRALNNSVIPIGFRVPRKHYTEFWEELYPDTPGPDPAMKAEEYLSGENRDPLKVSLRPAPEGTDGSAAVSSSDAPSSADSSSTNGANGSSSSSPAPVNLGGFTQAPPTGMAARHASVSSPAGTRNIFDTKAKEEVVEYYTPKEVKVVRSSKYRHIAGKSAMKIHQYDNMKVLSEAMQNRAIAGNSQWIGVSWQGVGGRVAIFNVDKDKGRAPTTDFGMLETGSAVLDFAFNPFKANQLVTAGENAVIKLWEIPDSGLRSLKANVKEAYAQLKGHNHKVVSAEFHPHVSSLLLSTSGDLTAKLWDVSTQQDLLTLSGFGDLVLSTSWNWAGNTLATTSKDRTLRLWDVRAQAEAQSGPDIGGMLGTKVAWLGKSDQLVLVGFDKNSERTIQVVDIKKLGSPLASLRMDNSSSVLTPHYDPDTGVLMLWGKGDTSVKFYELNNEGPMIHALTEHQTTVPQVGVALLHKTTVNVKEVEIAKIYKLSQTTIEPITFTVPRTKKEFFQDDIYTPTLSAEPSNDAASWAQGADKAPIEVSLQPEGMPKLSDAPKQVVEKRRVVVQDDSHMDIDKVKERMLGSLGNLANIEDQPIPGDENQGVDESEWDD